MVFKLTIAKVSIPANTILRMVKKRFLEWIREKTATQKRSLNNILPKKKKREWLDRNYQKITEKRS